MTSTFKLFLDFYFHLHMALFALTLLFCLRPTSTLAPCSRVPRLLVHPPFKTAYKCITQASHLQPTTMLELANGSCLMVNVCPVAVKADGIPLFTLKSRDDLILLLRTRAEGSTSPFQLLMNGPDNDSIVADNNLSGSIFPFRNPLLSEHLALFSRIDLIMSNGSTPHVNLTFSVDNTLQLNQEGSWFTKSNLKTAYPWKVGEIKASKFHYFSLRGNDEGLYFYMKLKGTKLCKELRGYIVVAESHASCKFQRTSFSTSYEFVPKHIASRLLTKYHLSLQFSLYGKLLNPIRWYQQIH